MQRTARTIVGGLLVLLWACGAPEPQPSPEAAPAADAAISDQSAISRIAFGSCAFQWAEQPIFRAVVATEPDLYLGDAIYGDFDGEKTFDVTPESLRQPGGLRDRCPDRRGRRHGGRRGRALDRQGDQPPQHRDRRHSADPAEESPTQGSRLERPLAVR